MVTPGDDMVWHWPEGKRYRFNSYGIRNMSHSITVMTHVAVTKYYVQIICSIVVESTLCMSVHYLYVIVSIKLPFKRLTIPRR